MTPDRVTYDSLTARLTFVFPNGIVQTFKNVRPLRAVREAARCHWERVKQRARTGE